MEEMEEWLHEEGKCPMCDLIYEAKRRHMNAVEVPVEYVRKHESMPAPNETE